LIESDQSHQPSQMRTSLLQRLQTRCP